MDKSLSFLHEEDFRKSEVMLGYIKSLLQHSKKDYCTKKAACFKCHSNNSELFLHQPITLTKLSDEIISTHPLCNVCLKKTELIN